MPRNPFDDGDDEGKDVGAFKKPHKLSGAVPADEDLVAYFRALEVPLSDALARVRGLAPALGAPTAPAPLQSVAALQEEEPLLLVAGAHREARGRHASLASHKKCSRVVESLLRASAAAQLLRFWEGLAPYAPYLCCNRYSSHVLQTLLSLAHAYLCGARAVEAGGGEGEAAGEGGGGGGGEEAAVAPEELRARLLGAACELLEALLPHLLQLLYDESATHVLRSLAALLSGAAPEALAGGGEGGGRGEEGSGGSGGGGKGGKGGKGGARHRRAGLGAGAGAAAAGEGDAAAAARAAAAAYRAALGPALGGRATAALSRLAAAVGALGEGAEGCSPEELGSLACDGNAGPTLSLLLRAARAGAPEGGGALARRLINFSPPGEPPAPAPGPHWVFRLLSHAVGSHLVEAVVAHGDAPLVGALAAGVFAGRLPRLAMHPFANFSVQRLLGAAAAGGCAPWGAAAVEELTPYVSALVGGGREGVVLALVRAAAGGREGESQGALLQALAAAAARPAADGGAAFSPPPPGGEGGDLGAPPAPPASAGERARSERVRAAAAEVLRPRDARLAAWWLSLGGCRGSGRAPAPPAPPPAAGASLAVPPAALSPLGASILAAALAFRPALARAVCDALLALPGGHIAGVASDPFGSRHLLEPLIERPPPELAGARVKLFVALKGWFAPLAAGRFGVWVAGKLFAALDGKKKAIVAREILDAERAIAGTPGGRALLKTMRLDHFKANAEGWVASWGRDAAKRQQLDGILALAGGAAAAPAARPSSPRADDGGACEEEGAGGGEEQEEQEEEEGGGAEGDALGAEGAAAGARDDAARAEGKAARKAARKSARRAARAAAAEAAAAAAASGKKRKRNGGGAFDVSGDSSESEGERERNARALSVSVAHAAPAAAPAVPAPAVHAPAAPRARPGEKDAAALSAALSRLRGGAAASGDAPASASGGEGGAGEGLQLFRTRGAQGKKARK
jgi:nucleolar protein 9